MTPFELRMAIVGGAGWIFGMFEIWSRNLSVARWVVAWGGLHAPSRGNAKSSVRAQDRLFVRTSAKVHSCVHTPCGGYGQRLENRKWACGSSEPARLSLSFFLSLFLFLSSWDLLWRSGERRGEGRKNGNQSGRDCTEINESRIIIMASC